ARVTKPDSTRRPKGPCLDWRPPSSQEPDAPQQQQPSSDPAEPNRWWPSRCRTAEAEAAIFANVAPIVARRRRRATARRATTCRSATRGKRIASRANGLTGRAAAAQLIVMAAQGGLGFGIGDRTFALLLE